MIPNTNKEILNELYTYSSTTRVLSEIIYKNSIEYINSSKNYVSIDKNKVVASYLNRITWKDYFDDGKGELFFVQLDKKNTISYM